MALHPDSYLSKFFTEDRLKAYRDLHQRFPLWCGEWRGSPQGIVEGTAWTAYYRLLKEARSFEPDVLSVRFDEEPSGSYVPPPRMVLDAPEMQETAPPETNGAILAAINYVFSWWKSGYGPAGSGEPYVTQTESLFEQWAEKACRELRDDSAAVGVYETKSYGFRLLNLRLEILSLPRGDARRGKLMTELKKLWTEIGSNVGVIPDISSGKELQLRGRPLTKLLMEGEDLVDAVARFDQEPDDVDAVSYLHLGGEAFLIERDKELIASLRRQGKDSKADQIVRDRIAQAMDGDDARALVRRLAFPMLDADELATVREASLTTDGAIQNTALNLIHSRIQAVGIEVEYDTLYRAVSDN